MPRTQSERRVVVVVVVVMVVVVAVADDDHSGRGHDHGHVDDHDLMRLSRDQGEARHLDRAGGTSEIHKLRSDMQPMAWYKRGKKQEEEPQTEKRSIPAGVFTKCPGCRQALLTADLHKNLDVCPACDHHFAMATRDRIAATMDEGSVVEFDHGIESIDPLGFRDSKRYSDRLKSSRKSSGEVEALIGLAGRIEGIEVEAGFFVFEFMGGSMGSVVGEKVTRVFERALERRVPALIFAASGGARMQEGILSLMQMAKTSAAIARLREAGVPYLSILLHPTTGGVAASFSMLGDLHIAEPRALIGFAGPRVIQNTIRQSLPPGFQRSEFLQLHGFVDLIVSRQELRPTIALALRWFGVRPRVGQR